MIQQIWLQNYRSYTDQTFQFKPGVNIISGPNGSGKTNLLEAILLICQGKSYRASDIDLIQHQKPWSKIQATFQDGSQRTIKIINGNYVSKEIQINHKIYKRMDEKNKLPVVVFEPNHLMIVSGSPAHRRDYLDDILEQTISRYSKTRVNYLKVLRQRNNLIKHKETRHDLLFPWNVRLSQLGGMIAIQRQQLIDKLNQTAESIYRQIAEDESNILMTYKACVDIEQYESQLMRKLETSLDLDIARGSTTYGPHREDMLIQINTKPLATIASRGEARTVMVTLKILEQQIKEAEDQHPTLLFDDVFSELDAKRSQYLADSIVHHQAFITSTNVYHLGNQTTNRIKLN